MIWLHIISDLKWVSFDKIDLDKDKLRTLISGLLKKIIYQNYEIIIILLIMKMK